MLELLGLVFGGFVAFFLVLLRYLPLNRRERTSGELFATFSAVALIFFVLAATGVLSADLATSQRVVAFYAGTASAYLLSRLMSPEYEEASRRMDEDKR